MESLILIFHVDFMALICFMASNFHGRIFHESYMKFHVNSMGKSLLFHWYVSGSEYIQTP